MEIIKLENYKENRFNTAIALGNFDGVHMGHQSLINSILETAKAKDLKIGILLFENHTKKLIDGEGPKLLTSRDQKLKVFSELGIEVVYSARFDKEIMTLTPEEFVKNILVDQLNVKLVTVGFDYRFGHKASGNIDTLKSLAEKYNFRVNVVEAQNKNETIISSTKIRDFLSQGKLPEAKNMLGRNYILTGHVVHGKSLGRKLGFPTANIELSENFLIPKSGVYITNTIVDNQTFKSVTSIGKNPTFDEDELKIETHIINFNREIYNQSIEVEFIEYIRDEMKFNSLEELKFQIEKDIEYVKSVY